MCDLNRAHFLPIFRRQRNRKRTREKTIKKRIHIISLLFLPLICLCRKTRELYSHVDTSCPMLKLLFISTSRTFARSARSPSPGRPRAFISRFHGEGSASPGDLSLPSSITNNALRGFSRVDRRGQRTARRNGSPLRKHKKRLQRLKRGRRLAAALAAGGSNKYASAVTLGLA